MPWGVGATDALGLTQLRDFDLAFGVGMVPSRTVDPSFAVPSDGKPNPAAPSNWIVGGPNRSLDLLLIFAADEDILAATKLLRERIAASGLEEIYCESASLLPGDKEHFGFQDGISQPGVLGTVEIGGVRRFLTTRYGVPGTQGVEFGKPDQPLLPPEQFILGDGEPKLRNGAFLVFRRLRQDVQRFYADTDLLASSLSANISVTVTGDALRAKIVGRWPSGQPLMRPIADAANPEPPMALNHFNFAHAVPDLVLSDGESISGAAGDPMS